MRKMLAWAAGLLSVVPVALTNAQTMLDAPVGETQSYRIDSGALANRKAEAWTVYQDHIRVADATWLRLYFGDCELEHGSFIRITSLRDGETQRFTKERLEIWSYASAYFNGDTVTVELIAAPGSTNNRLVVDAVDVGRRASSDRGSCGICGEDDRLSSSDPAAGRLWPAGCSVTLYNEDSCFVTAGHCLGDTAAILVQFNVPPSNPDCDTNNFCCRSELYYGDL